MSGPISSDYDAVVNGSDQARRGLSEPAPMQRPTSPVHPRLAAAVDDAEASNRRARERAREETDRTRDHTRGLRGLQEEGGRTVRGVSGSPLGALAGSPAAGASAPAAAPVATAAPMMAPAPMPAPPMPSIPPAGVASISPQLLAALVALTQDRAAEAAAAGTTPMLAGDPASQRSATTPQPGQPLDKSQVSFEKYPGGVLTPQQTAAVIDQALTINGIPNDPQLRAQWQQLYQHMAEGESARNPNAVNLVDTNATGPRAADGAPGNSSRGIWQCIPSTFAAYHMAGTSTSIYDPVASAAASINYVMDRYKVAPTGEGLAAFASARGLGRGTYTGY